jgi:hypothetical protein
MERPGRVPGTHELAIPKTPFIVPYRLQRNVIQILRVYLPLKAFRPAARPVEPLVAGAIGEVVGSLILQAHQP